MYYEIASALQAVSSQIDPNILMSTAYQSMLQAANMNLTEDATKDSDLHMCMSGIIAEWIQTQQNGQYPDKAQRNYILRLVDVLIDELWNRTLGRSVAEARNQQQIVLTAVKAALTMPEGRRAGRPSQGRSNRVQVMVSNALLAWLNEQRTPHETLSDAVNRLLFFARQES